MCEYNQKEYVGGFFMAGLDSVLEIEKIKGVLSNFSWKLVKQVITEQEITLTITKVPQHSQDDRDRKQD
jgi:hypothetical protein